MQNNLNSAYAVAQAAEIQQLVEDERVRKDAEAQNQNKAVLRTADAVESVDRQFNQLSSDLEKERSKRSKADKSNKRLAVIAIGISVISALIAALPYILPLLET